MLIRLLKIDWPVGFAAAAASEGWGKERRVFAFGALTAAAAIRQTELGGGKESRGSRGRVVSGREGGRPAWQNDHEYRPHRSRAGKKIGRDRPSILVTYTRLI